MSSILKMDFDFKKNFKEFLERMSVAYFLLDLHPIKSEIYETQHGYHVYVYLAENLDNWEIVAVQAILGSDFKRECFNLNRIKREPYKNSHRKWNLLFKRKWDHQGKLISSEKYHFKLTAWYNLILSDLYTDRNDT